MHPLQAIASCWNEEDQKNHEDVQVPGEDGNIPEMNIEVQHNTC